MTANTKGRVKIHSDDANVVKSVWTNSTKKRNEKIYFLTNCHIQLLPLPKHQHDVESRIVVSALNSVQYLQKKPS